MPKPIIDHVVVERIKTDMRTASTNNIMDFAISLQKAVEALLDALEAAR